MVWLLPSRIELLISSTPVSPRAAASIRCVTWFSISLGAAPGCATTTIAPGKSMSGKLLTSIRMNATRPASSSPTKNTIGGTGLRMHQDEMLRKFMDLIRLLRLRRLTLRQHPLPGIEERPRRHHDRFLAAQPFGDRHASLADLADPDAPALDRVAGADDVDIGALANR